MLKGCLAVVGVIALVVVGFVVYFAVRGVSALSAATVNGSRLSTIRVGQTRSDVDHVLGKDGSGDAAVFGSGHATPPGTTCRFFVSESQRHLAQLPVHRLCFSDRSHRLTSTTVYTVKP